MRRSPFLNSLILLHLFASTTGVIAAAQGGTVPAREHIKTVWIIVMENQNWSSIKGSKSAPYINETLLPMASHAEQYFNPPNIHPSLPNYIWMEAGTNLGIVNALSPLGNSKSTTQHLVTLLKNAPQGEVEWRSYQESISGEDCPLSDRYPYVVKHNPFVYFDDVTNRKKPDSAYSIEHIRPFEQLAKDLASNSTARYNFITPNICNDMHDSCRGHAEMSEFLGHCIRKIPRSFGRGAVCCGIQKRAMVMLP